MRRVRSLLALAIASSVTAVGIVAAVPVVAVGVPTPSAVSDEARGFTDSQPYTRYSQTVNGLDSVG